MAIFSYIPIAKQYRLEHSNNALAHTSATSEPQLPHRTDVPPAEPKPTPKPKPITSHPVIVVTETKVANNAEARHIEIVITLANQTSVDVNTHIVFTKFVVTPDGHERQTDQADERNVGFPALPFLYRLTYSFDTTQEGWANYMNGSFIKCVVNVSYPDRGGTTIYQFVGKTNPTIDYLDYIVSQWKHYS